MLKNKVLFNDLAKKISRSGKGFRDMQLIHPEREWTIGFVIMVGLFVVSAVWSYRSYVEFRELSVDDQKATPTDVVVYRESLVKAALAELEQRRATLEEYKKQVELQQDTERVETEQREVFNTGTTTSERSEASVTETGTSSIEIQEE